VSRLFLFSLDHTQTHTTVGRTPRDEGSARRKTSTWQHKHSQEKNVHAPGGIRTHDPSKRSASDLRLKPRDHWDRLWFSISSPKFGHWIYRSDLVYFLIMKSVFRREVCGLSLSRHSWSTDHKTVFFFRKIFCYVGSRRYISDMLLHSQVTRCISENFIIAIIRTWRNILCILVETSVMRGNCGAIGVPVSDILLAWG
jgi:hypothetical protein